MAEALPDLGVLFLDAQATGASPAHGAVLELAHARARATEKLEEADAAWVELPRGVRVSRIVRELTGYTDGCAALAIPARDAWGRVASAAAALQPDGAAPTLIHFAQFETPFLVDLHARFGAGAPFPLEIVCVHAIARRLFPDLPRSNIRALAGFLGHTTPHERRARDHVLATAHVWSLLVPRLAERGVDTWDALRAFLGSTRSRRSKRTYPMDKAIRAALPDAPGVYRFKRSNGDVLYVGKATSLKKRVAAHYAGAKRAPARAQEMLTQALDVEFTPTPTPLDAALLEVDEIKRLDPPYNVHLRERRAWFVSRTLDDASELPSDAHPLGPLPAPNATFGLGAILAFRATGDASPLVRARAMEVPMAFAPDEPSFRAAFAAFEAAHRLGPRRGRDLAVLRAATRISLRDDVDPETPTEDVRVWDEARIVRHLERAASAGARILLRARWLTLLAAARVEIVDLGVARAFEPSDPAPGGLRARQARFDGATYDRMRVLNTELKRILTGEQRVRGDVTVTVQLGGRVARLEGARLAALLLRT